MEEEYEVVVVVVGVYLDLLACFLRFPPLKIPFFFLRSKKTCLVDSVSARANPLVLCYLICSVFVFGFALLCFVLTIPLFPFLPSPQVDFSVVLFGCGILSFVNCSTYIMSVCSLISPPQLVCSVLYGRKKWR